MTRAQKNEWIQKNLKEQVLSNPSYVKTRKKILIIALIPAIFFALDRILAFILMPENIFSILWGLVLMVLIVWAAVNAETVTSAVLLLISAFLTAIQLFGVTIEMILSNMYLTILYGFYILFIISYVVAAILLLANPQIRAYHAHAKAVKKQAKQQAAQM